MTDYLLGAIVACGVLGCAFGARTALGMVEDAQRLAYKALEEARAAKKAGSGGERLLDALERLEAVELKVAGMNLTILDTTEKVAARLSDRERKRATREKQPAEDELDDEAAWWARARAAHPLPGMPTDQPPLLTMPEDEQ